MTKIMILCPASRPCRLLRANYSRDSRLRRICESRIASSTGNVRPTSSTSEGLLPIPMPVNEMTIIDPRQHQPPTPKFGDCPSSEILRQEAA